MFLINYVETLIYKTKFHPLLNLYYGKNHPLGCVFAFFLIKNEKEAPQYFDFFCPLLKLNPKVGNYKS
jgi:hypothetical protein